LPIMGAGTAMLDLSAIVLLSTSLARGAACAQFSAPQVSAWLPALSRALPNLAPLLSSRPSEFEAAALSPLIAALLGLPEADRLRRNLEHFDALPKAARREVLAAVEQARSSALTYFTGKPQPQADRDRVARAYRELRQAPADARVLSYDGADWMLRRREGKQYPLKLAHARSAARVIGGLVAQLHRAQVQAPGVLEAAARVVSRRLVLASIGAMARMRRDLAALLKDGVWDSYEDRKKPGSAP
jgi:hypothetical protein